MVNLDKIRIVSDFPTKGIRFYDITTILNDADEYQRIFNLLLEEAKKVKPDVIVALESRGYYFAPAMALTLQIPFVPIRKKGKLPFSTYNESYNLEYGKASIEIHTDALNSNQRVLLFDDILATGGTALAAINLINRFNPEFIHTLFFMELKALQGKEKLKGYDYTSLVVV